MRFVVAVPGIANVPGAHSVQSMHMSAFGVVLNCPAGHGAQTRFEVALPLVITSWPGLQSFQGTHCVAARLS